MTDDQTSADVTADRRHAIELAIEMRPEMALDELWQVLDRLGFTVDEATIEHDLDALGYDVVIEEEPAAPERVDEPAAPAAPSDGGEDDEASAALAASLHGAPDIDDEGDDDADPGDGPGTGDTDADDDRDDDDTEVDDGTPRDAATPGVLGAAGRHVSVRPEEAAPARSDRVTRVVAAVAIVAALVCVASLVWWFVDRSSDDPSDAEGPTTTEQPPSTADRDTTTTTEPSPSTIPPLTDPVEEMDFSETSELLPATSTGESWRPVAGDFATADGVAVSDPDMQVSVAVIPTPAGDLRAEVTLPEPSDRAGLAFAARDDGSYRAWVIDTAASTATLYLVEGTGREVELAPVEVSLAPGVVLGVSIEGDTTSLVVDGLVVATAPTREGSGIGLAALAPLTAATFDDLRVAHG